jgi:hypothetical protein
MLDNIFVTIAKFSRLTLGICLFILSLIVIAYASYLLKIEVTESEPKNNVALRFPTATEYVNNDPFWWLLNGSNNIRMINFSDERMKGVFTIKIYPNPAKEFVMIDLNEFNGQASELHLINTQGQFVTSIGVFDEAKTINLPLSNYSEGIYFLQILTDKGILNKKIIISK